MPTDEDCADSLHDVIDKRKYLLENLLVLLNSATDLGIEPSIAELRPRLGANGIVTNSARGHGSDFHVFTIIDNCLMVIFSRTAAVSWLEKVLVSYEEDVDSVGGCHLIWVARPYFMS